MHFSDDRGPRKTCLDFMEEVDRFCARNGKQEATTGLRIEQDFLLDRIEPALVVDGALCVALVRSVSFGEVFSLKGGKGFVEYRDLTESKVKPDPGGTAHLLKVPGKSEPRDVGGRMN